uniref:Uncharacterized protein n=1 Tax=Arion vulgaris TaxID=1028688 RepID=A0A0B6YB60_9EUPU
MNRTTAVRNQVPSLHVGDDYEQMKSEEIKKGLFSASRRPASDNDIKSFKIMHSPRVHKMAEWLLQYECAGRREKQYLQQFKELRQQFQTHDTDKITGPRYGDSSQSDIFWRPSRAPFTKSDDRTSKATCVLYPQKKRVMNHVLKDNYLQDSVTSHRESFIAPMSVNPSTYSMKKPRQLQNMGLDRNKTEYEPIEFIAKRNKLNFSRYFRESNLDR